MSELSARVSALLSESIACDAILPWSEYGDRELRAQTLPRYQRSGFGMVSLSLTSDAEGPEDLLHALGRVRREVRENKSIQLIETVGDIRQARSRGKLAVSLNVQGTFNLGGDINLVEVYYRLGIRQMVLVYNHKNKVGDGCHERTDGGLSRYGLDLIREMNAVGMLIDCAHTGFRTSMEAIEHSATPVVFSHSNAKALWPHDRNIRDEQALACAAKGGWIGVAGVGIFMGDDDSSTATVFRHIDHWVSLVGPDHVGLGTDYVYDPTDMQRYMQGVKSPESGNYEKMFNFFKPEQLPELVNCMLQAGYKDSAIRGILGENFLNVCERVWR